MSERKKIENIAIDMIHEIEQESSQTSYFDNTKQQKFINEIKILEEFLKRVDEIYMREGKFYG